jgi:chorismate lyase
VARARCGWRWRATLRPSELADHLWRDWLLDERSLTARLRLACGATFRVEVIAEGWCLPRLDEAQVLGVRHDVCCWVREVQLMRHDQVLVKARTVVPAKTLQGRGRRLQYLRTRPLGEFVFNQPGFRRGALQVARCDEHWGRRSVMWLYRRPLLVTEIFMDAVLAL